MKPCITPIVVKNRWNDPIEVPCGRCVYCRKKRVSHWSFRLMQEDKVHAMSLFVTLTYNTTNVKITPNGFLTLSKDDVQKFFKRLRKIQKEPIIRYYLCGEYGGQKKRPHYHIILFGSNHQNVIDAWRIDGKEIGSVHFGYVTGASVGYTLKYMCKPKTVPLHCNDDRVKEFSLMSKGLGKNYMTPAVMRWHKSDAENRMYVNIEGNKKASMPRYFKEKIYSEYERDIAGKKQLERMREEEAKIIEEFGLDTYEYMRQVRLIADTDKAQQDTSKRNNLKD